MYNNKKRHGFIWHQIWWNEKFLKNLNFNRIFQFLFLINNRSIHFNAIWALSWSYKIIRLNLKLVNTDKKMISYIQIQFVILSFSITQKKIIYSHFITHWFKWFRCSIYYVANFIVQNLTYFKWMYKNILKSVDQCIARYFVTETSVTVFRYARVLQHPDWTVPWLQVCQCYNLHDIPSR